MRAPPQRPRRMVVTRICPAPLRWGRCPSGPSRDTPGTGASEGLRILRRDRRPRHSRMPPPARPRTVPTVGSRAHSTRRCTWRRRRPSGGCFPGTRGDRVLGALPARHPRAPAGRRARRAARQRRHTVRESAAGCRRTPWTNAVRRGIRGAGAARPGPVADRQPPFVDQAEHCVHLVGRGSGALADHHGNLLLPAVADTVAPVADGWVGKGLRRRRDGDEPAGGRGGHPRSQPRLEVVGDDPGPEEEQSQSRKGSPTCRHGSASPRRRPPVLGREGREIQAEPGEWTASDTA